MAKLWVAPLTLFLGAIFLGLGILVKFSLFPIILESQIYSQLDLTPPKDGEDPSEGFDAFLEPPVPVYMNFMFFNVTNPEEMKNFGDIPIVNEIGPYVYREVRIKKHVTEVDRELLHYATYMEYHFDAQKSEERGCTFRGSPCSSEDKINVINPILLAAGGLLSDLPDDLTVNDILDEYGPQFGINISLPFPIAVSSIIDTIDGLMTDGEDDALQDDIILKNVTINELMYHGYRPGFVAAAVRLLWQYIQLFCSSILSGEDICDASEEDFFELLGQLSEQFSHGEFGLYKGKNATKANSNYVINNGRYDRHKFNKVVEVNGKTSLPENWWNLVGPSPSANDSGVYGICHDIYGTDGTMFPPFVEKDVRLWIFVGELCRSIWLDYDTDIEIHGVKAYRFRPPFSVFDMKSPDNFCYCPDFQECAEIVEETDEWNILPCFNGTKEVQCKDGFIRVGNCYGGVPIVMSAPHYWNVYPELLEQIEGMNPDKDKHDTTLDIEPNTGATISAHKRIQVNLQMKPYKHISFMKNLPRVDLFPILWADEGADLDEDNANKLKDALQKPINIVNGSTIAAMVLGGILIIIGLVVPCTIKGSQYNI